GRLLAPGVEQYLPFLYPYHPGNPECHRVVVGVEHDEERIVALWAAALVQLIQSFGGQDRAQAADPGGRPVLGCHLAAVGTQPDDVGWPIRRVDRRAAKVGCSPQARVRAAQRDHLAGEVEERLLALVETPVVPGDLVVLAVGVVVAALGAADLVAAQDHGDALGEQQRRQQVALLALAQRQDMPIIGGTFDAVVPGVVLVDAIAVALVVGLVVLVVVGN